MRIFALFVAIPLIEIALFIQIGGWLTVWPTLGIVVATALLGAIMVRHQGREAIEDLRRAFDELQDPTAPLAHGAMILFSGALLLTPGFLTDAVGFALLFPAVRVAVFRWLTRNFRMEHIVVGTPRQDRPGPYGGGDTEVVEGDYEEVEQGDETPRRRSGWTRH